ncbi:hypothetical protein [Aureispira anguillae]|uniref:Glycosyltransferase RgtA/B/C/D-like domain-containing protein n=1 Tax=Aureispira anguillae TaxID=2864201 RepID=A0A915YLH0_9BACT|nr:hypothetical protein [Aureispira anguillae]BDS15199.1 hypothetical protein AsAng_0059830 [Aureispira anguillae]
MKATQRITILFLFVAFAIGGGILASCLSLWLLNYEEFTTWVLEAVHKQAWRPYFEQTVFPPNRFQWARYIALLFLIFWGLALYYIYPRLTDFSRFLLEFTNRSKVFLKRQYQQFNPLEKRLFCLLMFLFALRGIVQLYRYELQYDEAWTYNHFVSNGFLIAAISPNNNHILYSLLACISDYLPLEAKYSLRLPVYLGGIATSGLFYLLVRNFWGWRWALVGLTWFVFSPGVCFYSLYARAYIFQLFFALLALWAGLKICNRANPSNYLWAVWGLAQILGFYAVPTYAYIWLLLNFVLLIHLLIRKKTFWKAWILTNLIVLGIVALLYFPFIITNGFQTLVNIASHKAPQGEIFIHYQDKVADWLLLGAGRLTPVYWFLVSITLGLIAVRLKNQQPQANPLIEITCLFLLFPSILNLTLGTQPPYRVWCFLSIFIGIALPCLATQWFPKPQNTFAILLVALSIGSFNIWRTEVHYAIRWSADLDRNAKEIAQLMLAKNIQTCYLFSNYDKPLLECYYLRAQQRLQTYMAAKDSKHYAPFVHAPLYQSVLWDKEDRVSTLEEKQWLDRHYPVIIYSDQRVELRQALK